MLVLDGCVQPAMAPNINAAAARVDKRLAALRREGRTDELLYEQLSSQSSQLRTLEVLRSPQQANPSWVSGDEWAALAPLLPAGCARMAR